MMRLYLRVIALRLGLKGTRRRNRADEQRLLLNNARDQMDKNAGAPPDQDRAGADRATVRGFPTRTPYRTMELTGSSDPPC